MTSQYLEHFLESVETLPYDLQRNFTLMRELDSTSMQTIQSIAKRTEEFFANIQSYSQQQRSELLKTLQEDFDKCLEYGDDKVELAMQTYDIVDKHIRRLDADLAKIETETADDQNGDLFGDDITDTPSSLKRKAQDTDLSSSKIAKQTIKAPARVAAPKDKVVKSKPKPEIIDMAIDPNEPTYCTCHSVSYGEMICCDNQECPTEWFHFGCVGLTSKPKGKWFCERCLDAKKKGR